MNTHLQNIISNFKTMDNQHFLDWFKENEQWMLDGEIKQLDNAYDKGFQDAQPLTRKRL